MTNVSRWSWLRTISQRVVPANAGTHHPCLKSEKKASAPVQKTRVRAAAMSAIALTAGSCVRRDDSLKIPYAIALPCGARESDPLRFNSQPAASPRLA